MYKDGFGGEGKERKKERIMICFYSWIDVSVILRGETITMDRIMSHVMWGE